MTAVAVFPLVALIYCVVLLFSFSFQGPQVVVQGFKVASECVMLSLEVGCWQRG